ncbi:MAG: PAS domain S-box protein [Deltaproteobacteria bacterium]|nr:PAS domain S-box protein [Deltaproteobacteria bacterium]
MKTDDRRYRQIFERMHEGYYETDLKGSLTFINNAVCKIAGATRDELIGLNYRDYTDEPTVKRIFDTFHRVYLTGKPDVIEYEITKKDGAKVIIENSASLLKDESGKKIGFYGLVIDITERKQAEKALEDAMARFEALFENANELIITTDANGYVLRLNKKVEDASGYSREELIGESVLKIAYPEDRDKYIQFWKDMLDGKNPRYELRGISKTGKIYYLLASGSVIKKDGKIVEIQYNAQDITERKQAEKALKEAKVNFEALFENANEIIITSDTKGYILRINNKAEEITGYSKKELIGKNVAMLAYPEDKAKYIQFWQDILSGLNPHYELRGISKAGKIYYLLASGSVIKKDGKIVEIQCNIQDITELKQAEQTIARLKDHLKSIIESSPNLIISFDKDGNIDMANPVAEIFFNRSATNLKGKRFSRIDPCLKRYEGIIEKVKKSKTPEFLPEETLVDKSKEVFDVNIYPLASNGVEGVVFNAADITEKKRVELQLLHAQKMETIGELAGGFAHDFNNILTGIIGNLSMLKITNDETKKTRYIDTIENISIHAKDLVQQMLVLSLKEEGEPENLSVNDLIEEVLNIATSSIPKSIQISFDSKNKDYNVFIDRTQFVQVLLNLIINARDAIGITKEGEITIKTYPTHIDKSAKRQYLLPKTGYFIKIDVSDNGCGMDKEILPRIFDPFFTTKGKGPTKGTGLGLSMAYNIIKNAGGSIRVYSEKGKGTKFSILLPLSKKKTGVTQQYEEMTPKKGHGNILLVDDEDMIRDIGKDMLEALGYTAVTAKDGLECIDILKKDGTKFDLVILDMIMPGMDGMHVLKEMKRQNINTRVIISTGLASNYEDGTDIISNSMVIGRLNKPFNMNELSNILAEILL